MVSVVPIARIRLVLFTVKMVEFAPCPITNANVVRDTMDLDVTKRFVVVTLVCVNLIAALTNKWWMWNMKLFAKMVVLVVLKRVLATKRFSEPFTKLLTNEPRTKNSNTYTYTTHFLICTISSLFNKK